MNEKISKFVGGRIRSLRRKHNLTQKELGEKLGVKHNTISSYEKGTNEPEQDTLFRMADVLGVSINDFFPYEDKLNALKSSEYRYLPTTISAGLPINVDGLTNADKISIPDSVMGKWAGHNDIIFTRISGDSMNNKMSDGSLIAIKSVDNVESLKDGDMVVFSHNHSYSVKYFYKRAGGLTFKPDSTNKEHDEQHFNSDEEIVIHGKVILYIVELD